MRRGLRGSLWLAVVTLAATGCKSQEGIYLVRRTNERILLDGIRGEESWRRAGRSPVFADAEGSPPSHGATAARLLWDQDNLYVHVEVADPEIMTSKRIGADRPAEGDRVGIFIDADRTGDGYVEIQIDPLNRLFDVWYPRGPTQQHSISWKSDTQSVVNIDGTVNVAKDRDVNWQVEMAIPWRAVIGESRDAGVTLPPQSKDTWHLNIVRLDRRRGSRDRAISSWKKISAKDERSPKQMVTVVFTTDDL